MSPLLCQHVQCRPAGPDGVPGRALNWWKYANTSNTGDSGTGGRAVV